MINFSNLELRVNKKYSFVGIEREENRLLFHLPKGFPSDDISLDTFDSKRDLFFRFYKVFKVFEGICAEKNETKNKISDRDGVAKENEGAEITVQPEHEETIVYSKVDFLDSILDVYDELKILALVSRLGRSEAIDYSQLHRYLNRGVFLPNNAIYIDSMTLPRLEVRYDETDIATMYSYILTEVKQQLDEAVSPEIIALSERFKQKYIGFDGSLFSGEYYQQIMDLLKDALELIDDRTPLKDADYWDFYDALETFLFGEINENKKGEIWGVNNFHSIWESMCLTYLVKTSRVSDILHIDEKFVSSQLKWEDANSIFDFPPNMFEFNKTKLRPDALTKNRTIDTLDKTKKLKIKDFKESKWRDDKEYKTTFIYQLEFNDDNSPTREKRLEIKKAYREQLPGTHTKELKLEEKLYSYWWIEAIDKMEILMVKKFNHVFYAAFIKRLFSLEEFSSFFNVPAFTSSLFRIGIAEKYASVEDIYKEFVHFCKVIFYFNLIDIKYLNFDDFVNAANVEEIKRRSVRKQFVYEYLIQKQLEKSEKLFKEWEIKSEFWLPVYSPDGPIFSEGPEYLDGYIKLVGVDIIRVIDKYVEDYATG